MEGLPLTAHICGCPWGKLGKVCLTPLSASCLPSALGGGTAWVAVIISLGRRQLFQTLVIASYM